MAAVEKGTGILLVEDDQSLVKGLEYALQKEGFSVKSAGTLKEGYALAFTGEYTLILLDVNLPDGNGFDLCRRLRRSSPVPVIFLTACDEEVNVVMGLDIGGDDYISKPFRINELISRIQAVIRRSSGVAGENLVCSGEFVLDRKSSRFLKQGRTLELSATEFRLVNALLGNRGNIMTREKLIDQLWDRQEHYIDTNTLSVYIRRLREKIEEDPGNPVHIETVRGMGYRWR